MSTAKGGRFRLVVKEGSTEWEFFSDKKSFTLGRTPKANFCVPLQILSSVHLEFTHVDGNKWFIADKNSTNGTYIQDKKMEVAKPYPLTSPFSVRIGQKTELEFQITDLVEANLAPKEVVKTTPMLVEDSKINGFALPRADVELEEKIKGLEVLYRQTKELNDQKNKEAYALTHRLESLRAEAELAEKKKLMLDSDLRGYEEAVNEKSETKNFIAKEVADLQRKLAHLAEQENESKKNLSAIQAEIEIFKKERELAHAAVSEISQKRDVLVSELDAQKSLIEDLKFQYSDQEKKLKEAFDKESEAHQELHKSLKLISEKEEQLGLLTGRLDHTKKELDQKSLAIDGLNLQLESLKRAYAQAEAEQSLFVSKQQLAKDALQLIESQRKSSEAAVDTLRAELLAVEGKLRRLNAEVSELEDKAIKLRSEVNSQMHKSQELEESIASLKLTESHLQKEHLVQLAQLESEIKLLNQEEHEKLQSSLRIAKQEYEEWEKSERESINAELKARKDDLLHWEASERERLQAQFSSQAEKIEKDLAERKQKELLAIEELRAKWNRDREAKRPLEIKEITRSSSEILSAHLLNLQLEAEKRDSIVAAYKKDLEAVVRSVLLSGASAQVETHLKAALVQSPGETLKAKRQRKAWAIQSGLALAIFLFCMIFPQVPQSLWETSTSVFRRDPQSADQFVERIRLARLNRPKFMPERDRVFRNTYTDNIIYLEDYSEIKSDPDIKKAWTLALNQFFVKQLDMDERIIVSFMAIESPLVRELTEMSTKIQLNQQEADISRMRAFEDLSTPRLIEAVQGRENYDKFRHFEMKFYDEYSNKLNVPSSTP